MKLAFILISISALSFSCTTEPQGSFSDIPKDYNKLAEDRIQELSDGAIIFKCIKEYHAWKYIDIREDTGMGKVSDYKVLWNDQKGIFLLFQEENGKKSLREEYKIVDTILSRSDGELYLYEYEVTWDKKFHTISFLKYATNKWRMTITHAPLSEEYAPLSEYYVLNKYNLN